MAAPLTIVTFNAGLLRAFGGLIEPAPFIDERRIAIAGALASSGADLILLQEVYGDASRRALAAAMPHSTFGSRRSGLLALSTSPISASLIPFVHTTLEERFFDRKGVLVVHRGDVVVLNIHMTAGGLRHHPESAAADAIRAHQIEQLFGIADEQRESMVIIAGDLNAGPNVSPSNYDLFAQRGWIDVHELLHPGTSDVTWDPNNALNRRGPHRSSPPQRVDHVFVRRGDVETGRVTPQSSEIMFAEPIVPAAAGPVTLSDHYGLCVTMIPKR